MNIEDNMVIVLDVSEPRKESVFVLGENEKYEAGNGMILVLVQQILETRALSPKDLDGIFVVLGQGRFTSTRSATLIANCFSVFSNIHIAVGSREDLLSESIIYQKLAEQRQNYIFPSYYAEPNITHKKD